MSQFLTAKTLWPTALAIGKFRCPELLQGRTPKGWMRQANNLQIPEFPRESILCQFHFGTTFDTSSEFTFGKTAL
jgi:hypothetical protein